MNEKEGIIKYNLNHQGAEIEKDISIIEINAWRTILFKLQLIGQIDARYDGYGFGNISQKINDKNNSSNFIISGTQTGTIESLSKQHYCLVIEASPQRNSITSIGKIKPSSEALTHACVYQQDKNINAVIHVHCPEIWNYTRLLKLPYTSADIEYGTPEMANEVKRLFDSGQLKDTHIFSMLGHKDGVIAFSESMEKAAFAIISYYSKAIVLEQNKSQR